MSDVPTLAHGRQYVGTALPADEDGSENAGFVVFGESGDDDVLFWSCAYRMSPAPRTQWVVPDARIHATIFMAIPRGEPAALADNDFVRQGLHLPEYLEPPPFTTDDSDDRVVWSVGDRRYMWDPPAWRIEGEHAGVDVSLALHAAGPASWAAGPFEQITENRSGGYDVPIRGSGTVRAGGRTYALDDAYGSHERVAIGQGRDIVAEVGGGAEVFVADLFAGDTHLWFGEHTGRQMVFGRIDIGGRSLHAVPAAGQGLMSVTTLERWPDPRSGLLMPARWRVVMSAEDVSAELDIRAVGRAYWHYTTRSGVMVMVWQLSRADGAITLGDGSTTEVSDALVASRWGRSLLVTEETLAGPRFVVQDELAGVRP